MKLLIKIKNSGLYKDEIDTTTANKDLQNAILQRANLKRANLLGTNLLGADLQGAIYNNKTMFPRWV